MAPKIYELTGTTLLDNGKYRCASALPWTLTSASIMWWSKRVVSVLHSDGVTFHCCWALGPADVERVPHMWGMSCLSAWHQPLT